MVADLHIVEETVTSFRGHQTLFVIVAATDDALHYHYHRFETEEKAVHGLEYILSVAGTGRSLKEVEMSKLDRRYWQRITLQGR